MGYHAVNRIQEGPGFFIRQLDGIAAGRLVGCAPGHMTRCHVDTIVCVTKNLGFRQPARYFAMSGNHTKRGLIKNRASSFWLCCVSESKTRVVTRPSNDSSRGST